MDSNFKMSFTRLSQPCQTDCKNRSADCHSTCEAYLAYYAARRKEAEENIKNCGNYNAINSFAMKRAEKNRRKHGKNPGALP